MVQVFVMFNPLLTADHHQPQPTAVVVVDFFADFVGEKG